MKAIKITALQGIKQLEPILDKEVVHIEDSGVAKYVILKEDAYQALLNHHFEEETLFSYASYLEGQGSKGNASKLFEDIGI